MSMTIKDGGIPQYIIPTAVNNSVEVEHDVVEVEQPANILLPQVVSESSSTTDKLNSVAMPVITATHASAIQNNVDDDGDGVHAFSANQDRSTPATGIREKSRPAMTPNPEPSVDDDGIEPSPYGYAVVSTPTNTILLQEPPHVDFDALKSAAQEKVGERHRGRWTSPTLARKSILGDQSPNIPASSRGLSGRKIARSLVISPAEKTRRLQEYHSIFFGELLTKLYDEVKKKRSHIENDRNEILAIEQKSSPNEADIARVDSIVAKHQRREQLVNTLIPQVQQLATLDQIPEDKLPAEYAEEAKRYAAEKLILYANQRGITLPTDDNNQSSQNPRTDLSYRNTSRSLVMTPAEKRSILRMYYTAFFAELLLKLHKEVREEISHIERDLEEIIALEKKSLLTEEDEKKLTSLQAKPNRREQLDVLLPKVQQLAALEEIHEEELPAEYAEDAKRYAAIKLNQYVDQHGIILPDDNNQSSQNLRNENPSSSSTTSISVASSSTSSSRVQPPLFSPKQMSIGERDQMLIGFLTEYFRLQAQFAKTELEDDKTKPSEKLSLESEIRQFYKIAEVIAAGELSDMIIQMPSRYRIDARKFAIARVAEHLSINKDLVIPRNDSHKPLVQYLFSE